MALFTVTVIAEGNVEKAEELARLAVKDLRHYDFSIYDATLTVIANEGKRINLDEEES